MGKVRVVSVTFSSPSSSSLVLLVASLSFLMSQLWSSRPDSYCHRITVPSWERARQRERGINCKTKLTIHPLNQGLTGGAKSCASQRAGGFWHVLRDSLLIQTGATPVAPQGSTENWRTWRDPRTHLRKGSVVLQTPLYLTDKNTATCCCCCKPK